MDLTQDIIIIGAGQAGLSASYFLQKEGIKHVILEQNEIGSSWIWQRWDSFKMNTPNWMSWFPGMELPTEIREHFMTKDEFVTYLRKYVDTFELPVMEGYKVVRLKYQNELFIISTENNGQQTEWRAKSVIVASGMMNKVQLHRSSPYISPNIMQLHASEYKNPQQLPEGNILVVGAAQSGCQIAEELALAGRKAYLASSMVPRVPRRYKGKDIMEWMDLMGTHDITVQQLQQNPKLNATQPQSSGMGLLGHTVSYQSLHRMGVQILGSLNSVENGIFNFEDNAKANILFADECSANIKNGIDEFINRHSNIRASDEETDEADFPDKELTSAHTSKEISPTDKNITTIIWATGFGYDFSYMEAKFLDESGKPKHTNGKIYEGLYCLGFPWLRKKKSGLIYGVREDAELIVQELLNGKKIK